VTQLAQDRGRRETVNLRWRAQDRQLIDRAVSARGGTRTDFILEAARQRATDVLLNQVYIELDSDAFAEFVAELERPPTTNARLAKTLATPAPWEED
jgi:uncharacterized protein (DUF1778 family)